MAGLEVKGRGVVTVVDGSAALTTAYTATGTQPLMISGVRLHRLPRGAVFDLYGAAAGVRARPAGHQRAAGHRPTGRRARGHPAGSRRIAAEGAHESTAELRRRPASS